MAEIPAIVRPRAGQRVGPLPARPPGSRTSAMRDSCAWHDIDVSEDPPDSPKSGSGPVRVKP